MTKRILLGATALQTFVAFGLASAFATPAFAEDGAATAETSKAVAADASLEAAQPTDGSEVQLAENTASNDAIVVTGSRIRRPNLESQIPVTSITGESFIQQSSLSIGDTLNELPQLRSTFAQSNPGLGIGIAGLNLLDLRGLGTVRTLTLVNGRRHVGADILNNAVSPDVNTIPSDLLERVDVVTGGNSAVYGSDAIAGVVNFVMKRDYNGLQVRGNFGQAEEGFGGSQYVSAMFGHNFADGRGNVTVHGEFAHQKRIFASDIPWLRSNDGFLVVDVDPSGLPEGSDGFPDRTFFHDIRSAAINRFGLIPITQGAGAACGMGIGSTNGQPSTIGGLPFNCTFIFDDAGNLSAQTGTRVGQGIIGGIVGGNGQTGREDRLLSVLPKMTRYNFNALAHYTISDALEPFIEAKWVRVDTQGSNFGPSFMQGTFTQFDIRERVRIDNPFLTGAQRTTVANAILTSGCNTSLQTACVTTSGAPATRTTFGGQGIGGPLNAADIAAINNGTYRFVLSRTLADAGIRDEKFQRDTFRFVAGLRGNFNDDWNYEVSVNYGKMTEDTTTFGFLDRQRFMLSLDAGIDPANPGAGIQCRAKFDPAAAVAFPNNPTNVARLAADIAACIPYNPFGGSDNSAAVDYFSFDARNKAKMTQLDIQGFVAGDSSQLFELPGGPVSFVVGGEYRRETADYRQDPFVADGFTNGVAIGSINPDPFKVKEIYGEVQVPLLKDEPFFEELTLSGAGRLSWYGGAIGSVKTYNAGIEWSPIRDIRFRANYGRAIRAPNFGEAAFPVVPNFAPGFLDPCAAGQIGANPNRAANCLADLGPTLLAGLPNITVSLPVLSGSNPNLQPEESDSYTVGAVVQPRFIPGLSVSVDWYKINVNNVIVQLSAQAIANGCYDAATLNNPFCPLFQRHLGSGAGPNNEPPGTIISNSLLQAPANFAKRVREGIDVEAAYRTTVGSVKLDTRLIYTHNFKISNFQDPSFPDFENRILGELGDPQDEFRWDVSATHGAFTLAYQMSYIGKMVTNLFEDFHEVPGACNTITGACPPFNSDFADIENFPSVIYHDIRLDYNVKNLGGIGKDYLFFVGIDNFTDKKPPLGSTATGAGSAIYNVLGRRYFAGFRARF
jgi:outer membrane receptor protein involved in Fe transport